jgi:hypothetical protein
VGRVPSWSNGAAGTSFFDVRVDRRLRNFDFTSDCENFPSAKTAKFLILAHVTLALTRT